MQFAPLGQSAAVGPEWVSDSLYPFESRSSPRRPPCTTSTGIGRPGRVRAREPEPVLRAPSRLTAQGPVPLRRARPPGVRSVGARRPARGPSSRLPAANFAALMDHLDLQDITLLADWGGPIVLDFAPPPGPGFADRDRCCSWWTSADYLKSLRDQELVLDRNFLREVGEVCKDLRASWPGCRRRSSTASGPTWLTVCAREGSLRSASHCAQGCEIRGFRTPAQGAHHPTSVDDASARNLV